MKWYLSLVAALFAGTLGCQVFEMMRWTPSVETLSQTTRVTALAQMGVPTSGGRVHYGRSLKLDGHDVVCDVPHVDSCERRFRDMRDGEKITADLVRVPTGGGGFWLAMGMRRENGDMYRNAPEKTVDAWRSDARGMMLITAGSIVFFLLIFPACASARFRQAWWATIDPVGSAGREAATPAP